MISKDVLEAIRHGSIEDALSKAHDARNEHIAAAESYHSKRLESVDVRSLFLTGFAIVQGAIDIMFTVWWHGR